MSSPVTRGPAPPPPSTAAQGSYLGGGSYSGPIGSPAGPAIAQVHDGVALYRWALVVGILVQLTALVAILLNPALGQLLSASATGGLSSEASASSLSAALGGYVALSDLLQLVAFILALVAFSRWRGGVKIVGRIARNWDLGFTGEVDAAERSEAGYRHSLYTMLLWVLVTIVGALALVALLLGHLTPTLNPNGTVTPPSSTQVQNAVVSSIPFLVGFTVVLLLVQLLLAYFVTESLDGFVELAGRKAELLTNPEPRVLVFVGVLFGITGVLNFVYPGAGALAIVGPLLLLWACQRYMTDLVPRPAF